jgi:enoyl-CoA hydratase/carnithine racemase
MRLIVSSAIPAARLYDVLQLAEPLSVAEAYSLGTFHLLCEDFDALDAAGVTIASLFAGLQREAFARTKQRLWAADAERVQAALETE